VAHPCHVAFGLCYVRSGFRGRSQVSPSSGHRLRSWRQGLSVQTCYWENFFARIIRQTRVIRAKFTPDSGYAYGLLRAIKNHTDNTKSNTEGAGNIIGCTFGRLACSCIESGPIASPKLEKGGNVLKNVKLTSWFVIGNTGLARRCVSSLRPPYSASATCRAKPGTSRGLAGD
jgi:hypothetical protein